MQQILLFYFPLRSDFHSVYQCQNFVSNYLGYNAYTTYTNFDDEDDQSDDGTSFDDVQACCLPSELSDYCPYPTCGSDNGDGGGNGPPMAAVHNKQTPVVGLTAAAQPAEASTAADATSTAAAAATTTTTSATERPPLWWQSAAGRRAVQLQSKQRTQSKQTTLGENPISSYDREYSLTQQRNEACYFDEKYQLWVKTSCHGKSSTDLLFTL